MPSVPKLFMSFNSRDRDRVRAVQRFLAERGVATFFEAQTYAQA